jgi:hypothetical protein
MLLAHKIALDPNAAQRLYFARAAGTARFAWNWALAEWKAQYKAGGKPSDVSLRRDLNKVKREQFPWVYDVSKCVVQEAIIDLGAAFRTFFEKRGRYPQFKRKDGRASFCAANEAGTFRTDGKRIKLPVIAWIRMREAVRFAGLLKRVTVSREGDRWFVSILVETDDVKPVDQPKPAVGDVAVDDQRARGEKVASVTIEPRRAAPSGAVGLLESRVGEVEVFNVQRGRINAQRFNERIDAGKAGALPNGYALARNGWRLPHRAEESFERGDASDLVA